MKDVAGTKTQTEWMKRALLALAALREAGLEDVADHVLTVTYKELDSELQAAGKRESVRQQLAAEAGSKDVFMRFAAAVMLVVKYKEALEDVRAAFITNQSAEEIANIARTALGE